MLSLKIIYIHRIFFNIPFYESLYISESRKSQRKHFGYLGKTYKNEQLLWKMQAIAAIRMLRKIFKLSSSRVGEFLESFFVR